MVLSIYSRKAWKEYLLPPFGQEEVVVHLSKEYYGIQESEDLTLQQQDGKWTFQVPARGKIRKKKEEFYRKPLNENTILTYKTIHNELFTILIRKKERVFYPYKKYYLPSDGNITIGRGEDNLLVYDYLNIVSEHHCKLIGKNGIYTAKNESPNGIYINGYRIEKELELKFGDIIHVMGLQMVYLGNVLAIDSETKGLEIKKTLVPYQNVVLEKAICTTGKKEVYFHRSPRMIYQIQEKTTKIDTMEEFVSREKEKYGFAFPFLKEKQKKKYENYLAKKQQEIEGTWNWIRNQVEKQYPPVQNCMEKYREDGLLWSRTPEHEDFLKYRIGTRSTDDFVKVKLSGNLEWDCSKAEDILAFLDLQKFSSVGICGEDQFPIRMMQILVGQIGANNCYTEVKMGFFCYGEEEKNQMKFVKWMPHVWNKNGQMRYTAANPKETVRVLEMIKKEIQSSRKSKGMEEIHYVLFVTKNSGLEEEIWQDFVMNQKDRITVLFFEKQRKDLPHLFMTKMVKGFVMEIILANRMYLSREKTTI